MDLREQAKALGIAVDFYTIDGEHHALDEAQLSAFIALLAAPTQGDYAGSLLLEASGGELELPKQAFPVVAVDMLDETYARVAGLEANVETQTLHYPALDYGYYTLRVAGEHQRAIYQCIVAPAKVYTAPALETAPQTGLTLQFYGLRSARNWGIGDFADLSRLLESVGKADLTFIGINPLHALFTSHPASASPYSPSSRIWLNPLYLAVDEIPAFQQSDAAQSWFSSAPIQAKLGALRESETVDYAAVWALKKAALQQAFAAFCKDARHAAAREAFAIFQAQKEVALKYFALFEAIDNELNLGNGGGWSNWPAEFQDSESACVQGFLATHQEEVTFYQWLQWLCDVQLTALQSKAKSVGVALGIYGDLAVGCARGGADTWVRRRDYSLAASIGAPPDPLGPVGQNWQLPPFNPQQLNVTGFAAFITLLRANMRLYGVIRIDHVMSLSRLWWILGDESAQTGAYVQYPLAHLMAILAIESHRARCTVIGEDLGTVSDALRASLAQYGVYSYCVLYFMQQQQTFIAPNRYPKRALSVTSNHDLAPLSGFWQGADIAQFAKLGVYDEATAAQAHSAREVQKQALFQAIKQAGVVPWNTPYRAELTPALATAIQVFAASAASQLHALQLENVLGMTANFNLPGVAAGYPNWAVKLPLTLAQLEEAAPLTLLRQKIRDNTTMQENLSQLQAAPYPPLDAQEVTTIDALFAARCGDPFAYLGVHELASGKTVIRSMQPQAQEVFVYAKNHTACVAKLQAIDARGLFAGEVDKDALAAGYVLDVVYADGAHQRKEDVYAFWSHLQELDAWLFAEGKHRRPFEMLGAHRVAVAGVAGVKFSVWAPNAKRVSVVGDFNFWDGRMHPMRFHQKIGVWEIFIPDVDVGALYKYEVLGADDVVRLKADPLAFAAQLRPDTASIVAPLPEKIPTDAARGVRNHTNQPISIFEVHLGSWRRHLEDDSCLSYAELAQDLVAYVKDMGFTHIECLPLAEYPFDDSWGYQATGLYAPTARYGSPEMLKALLESAHAAGINVILDWVVGHFPTDDYGLARFDGTHLYEYANPQEGFHQDWNTLIYNFSRDEVRNYLSANALYWIERFGFDGLRVDAVASMIYRDYSRPQGEWVPNRYGGRENLEAIDFLRTTNTMLHQEAANSVTFAEESTSFTGVTAESGLNFNYKWNMGWMNDTLRYMQEDPLYRCYHHDLMTFGMAYHYSERFVLPLSHDEVVHGKRSMLSKMPGDRWQQFANLRAYYGFMYAHPGKKLLFMGNEFAQVREWNFHHSLDWHLLEENQDAGHRGMQAWVKALNQVYRVLPALSELDQAPTGFDWLVVDDKENSVFVFERIDSAGNRVIAVSNFTPQVLKNYRFGVNQAGRYSVVLNSDDEKFHGSGVGSAAVESEAIASHQRAQSITLTIGPLATLYLQWQREA